MVFRWRAAGSFLLPSFTQRQKLSSTDCVAKFFRVLLCDVNKPKYWNNREHENTRTGHFTSEVGIKGEQYPLTIALIKL